MSQVIIAGDTSGTITLQAPAVSGSSVLTLPATTATLATLTTPSFASTIGVGGATASASGAGITFPATQSASTDANTLDDYEEGTFTPVVNGQNQPTGVYTKVGRLVTIAGDITLSFTGGAQSAMSGFPFSTALTQYGNMLPYQSVSANPIGMLVISGAACNFYDGKTNLVTFTTGSRIIFTQTYYTT